MQTPDTIPTQMQTSRVFEDIMRAWLDGKRGILLQGGTGSSKTFSALQFLHVVASNARTPLVISVVSESLPHLKIGCIRDFFKILGESMDSASWSKTEFMYRYRNGSVIEFWGADNEGKARGPRRHILFINEGNNVPWMVAEQANTRTEKFVIVDWNPTGEFWVHEYQSGDTLVPGWKHSPRFAFSHSTYLDAKGLLPQSVVENIEAHKDIDPNWWSIYGLGELGKLEHLIWPHLHIVDDLPPKDTWRSWGYGLDFGFVHPTVLMKVVMCAEKVYWDQCLFQSKLTNADLIEKLTHEERAEIYADSAEPDRIAEIGKAGWAIFPANKDVKMGLDVVRRQPLYITKRSVETIKQIRNYRRQIDKRTSKVLEDPLKVEDDGPDSGRYAQMGLTERFGFVTASPMRPGDLHSGVMRVFARR